MNVGIYLSKGSLDRQPTPLDGSRKSWDDKNIRRGQRNFSEDEIYLWANEPIVWAISGHICESRLKNVPAAFR